MKAQLSVMTLNLRFGLADDGPHSWSLRKEALAGLLESHPADFYAFQEANDFQIEFLASRLPGYAFIGKRHPAPSFWQNNVIFYASKRWQLQAKDHFFLSPTPDIPSRYRQSQWPRQCTFGLFTSGHKTLVCINTHLDFDPRVQQAGARIIVRRLERFCPDSAAIMMGDFNCHRGSAAYKVLTREAHPAAFKNVFKKRQPATHHEFTGIGKDRAIDWILYRGPLRPLNAKVISATYQGILVSDHFPVTADFNWSSQPFCDSSRGKSC